jgi:hypothetical protein
METTPKSTQKEWVDFYAYIMEMKGVEFNTFNLESYRDIAGERNIMR